MSHRIKRLLLPFRKSKLSRSSAMERRTTSQHFARSHIASGASGVASLRPVGTPTGPPDGQGSFRPSFGGAGMPRQPRRTRRVRHPHVQLSPEPLCGLAA